MARIIYTQGGAVVMVVAFCIYYTGSQRNNDVDAALKKASARIAHIHAADRKYIVYAHLNFHLFISDAHPGKSCKAPAAFFVYAVAECGFFKLARHNQTVRVRM
jgi:sugar phosphate isomerase/epimerase